MKKLTRRDFLRTSALTGAAAALAGAMPLAASAEPPATSASSAVDEENCLPRIKAKVGPVYTPQDVAVTPQQIHVTGGDIMGFKSSDVYVFKGIPYGTAGRFEQAVPASWKGIRSCYTWGEVCPQNRSMNGFHANDAEWATPSGSDMVGNEASCLNLNVWTNSIDSTAKKTVVVFVHGGGGTSGSTGELATYDGFNFAATTNCVFVSINKRVNFLGKLNVSAYGGEEYKNSGNNTLLDTVLGLEWVRDNISKFGGDPSNVTLFAQSAGTRESWDLASMPVTVNLFKRAVMTSSGFSLARSKESSLADTEKVVEQMKKQGIVSNNASKAEILEKLTTLRFEDLFDICNAVGVGAPQTHYGVDVFPEAQYDPATHKMNQYVKTHEYFVLHNLSEFGTSGEQFILDSRYHGATVNDTDGSSYTTVDINACRSNMTDADKQAVILSRLGGDGTDVEKQSRADALVSEFQRLFPNHEAIDAPYFINNRYIRSGQGMCQYLAENDIPVYNGIIGYTLPFMGGVTMWHSGDFPLYLNNIDKVIWQYQGDLKNAYRLASAVSSAIAAYATTGDPSTTYLKIEPYTRENRNTAIFDSDLHVVQNVRGGFDQILGLGDPTP